MIAARKDLIYFWIDSFQQDQ